MKALARTYLFAACLLLAVDEEAAVKVYDCEGEKSTYEVVDLTSTARCLDPELDYEGKEQRRIQMLHQDPIKRIAPGTEDNLAGRSQPRRTM